MAGGLGKKSPQVEDLSVMDTPTSSQKPKQNGSRLESSRKKDWKVGICISLSMSSIIFSRWPFFLGLFVFYGVTGSPV